MTSWGEKSSSTQTPERKPFCKKFDALAGSKSRVKYMISSLNSKKAKISGRIPAALYIRLGLLATETEKRLHVTTGSPEDRISVSKKPLKRPKKLGPPGGSDSRSTERVKEQASMPLTPKPLKVIRRRGEETPKIFETVPKIFPNAILEGIKGGDAAEEIE